MCAVRQLFLSIAILYYSVHLAIGLPLLDKTLKSQAVTLLLHRTCTKRVLVVLTSADHLKLKNGKRVPSGNFLNELAIPAMALHEAGFSLTYATPSGLPPTLVGRSPMYFNSAASYSKALAFVDDPLTGPIGSSVQKLSKLSDGDIQSFDAVFIPGGNAVLMDLCSDVAVGSVLQHFHENGKLTAAICNGVCALSAVNSLRAWPYEGYQMTAFSNTEWRVLQPGLAELFAPRTEDMLRKRGARFEANTPGHALVVEDHELVTGQNPASSQQLADRLIDRLKRQCFL